MNHETNLCHAVLFDMDGVLIDSEPLWQEAEREAFSSVGIDLSPRQMAWTVGLRIEEVAAFWFRRFPWRGPSTDEIASAIVTRMVELIGERGEPLLGARRAVVDAHARGVPLAVASSSSYRLIDAVLDRLDLSSCFAAVASAEDETHGKPHPAVFLSAATKVAVPATECLVIEDSLHGVIAAKAARMKCVAVPDARLRDDRRFVLADEVFESLTDIDAGVWDRWLSSPG